MRIVYFHPTVKLNKEQMKELESVNLWDKDIKEKNFRKNSPEEIFFKIYLF